MSWKKWIAAIFPIQILFFSWMSNKPDWIENIYIRYLFNPITTFLRYALGSIELSIGLTIFYILLIFIVYRLVIIIRSAINHKLNYKTFTLNILCYTSITYGLYMVTWGIVYYRKSSAEISHLDTKNISFEEIKSLGDTLIVLTNNSRKLIKDREARSENIKQFFSQAKNGFDLASKEFPELKYNNVSIKIGFNKSILSYMGTAGVYSFPTAEANVNANNAAFEAPFTICHEMAHQLGFASEDEANYISYLACVKNPNPIFKYSAYSDALTYTLNNIYQQDSLLYYKMKSEIDSSVLQDFEYSRSKWKKYQISWVRKTSSNIYDLFLKSNNQEEGIKSYSLMIELLIGDMRKNKSLNISKHI